MNLLRDLIAHIFLSWAIEIGSRDFAVWLRDELHVQARSSSGTGESK